MMADVKIIISAVDKTKGAIGSVTGSLGKLGGLAAKGLAVGLGATAAGIGAIGVASAKLAIDAVPIKGVQDAFFGLADAAGVGGDAMLAALQKGSAGMIDNVALMQSFNKAAQLVSQDFAVQLPDAMGYLGKVAAATGQDMGFMMDSLVTGVGRLSPMILDNLGIQVSLTEANEAYAETLGKSATELTKSEQQTAVMNMVLEKLAENTAAMPDVVGSAAQEWAVLGVQFKNIKTEVGLALLPVFQRVIGVLGKFVSNALPVVVAFIHNQFVPALNNIWSFIETNLIPIIQNVAAWLGEVLPPIIATLAQFWNEILFPALSAVWEFLTVDMMPVWEALGELLGVILTAAINLLVGIWNTLLKPALEAIWDVLTTYVIPAVTDFIGGIDGIVSAIQTVIKWVTDFISLLGSIKLPDWLVGKSPSPFENTLWGIVGAMKELNQEMAMNPVMSGGGSRFASSGTTVHYHQNLTIHSNAQTEQVSDSFELMRALA